MRNKAQVHGKTQSWTLAKHSRTIQGRGMVDNGYARYRIAVN